MRTNEEFVGEVRRRSVVYKEKQKRKKRILISCIPLMLCCICIIAVYLRTDHIMNISDGAENAGGVADGASGTVFACKAVINGHPRLGESYETENTDDILALENAVKNALYNSLEIKEGEAYGYTVTFTMSNGTEESYIISDNTISINGKIYVIPDSFISEITQLINNY